MLEGFLESKYRRRKSIAYSNEISDHDGVLFANDPNVLIEDPNHLTTITPLPLPIRKRKSISNLNIAEEVKRGKIEVFQKIINDESWNQFSQLAKDKIMADYEEVILGK